MSRRLAVRIARSLRRPFPRLVAHFLHRLVRSGQESAADSELGAGPLLGLLAAPGALISLVMLDKYSSVLNLLRGRLRVDIFVASLDDKYLFLSMAMAVTGIVTVLKWDRILPDSQDYLNLAPLPIRPSRILLANAAAIAIAVTVFAVDVNVFSAILFPLFVTASAEASAAVYLRFAAAHAACVLLASLFTFCGVFAVLGTLAAILPRHTFRACVSWIRGIILLALAMLLLSGFSGHALGWRLHHVPHSAVRWLPSVWYLGLYQSLQHRATPALAWAARTGLWAAAAAFTAMPLTYALSYRRRFAAILEGERRPSQQRLLAVALASLDLFAARAPGFERACHRFAVRALLRNEGHRLCLVVALGLGWLLAFQGSAAGLAARPPADGLPPAALLAPTLSAAYLLVLGLRLAFDLPASVPSNWIFRVVLNLRDSQSLSAARRIVIAFLTPTVLLPALAFAWWRWGAAFALLHTAYALALSLCYTEILLSGYRKIPLTCPMPGFRDSLLAMCLAQFLGFEFFTRAGAALEHWMFAYPPCFPLLPAFMAAAWYWNQRRLRDARDNGELEEGVTFENAPLSSAIERLDLS
jgi:hypothetical protein